MHVTSMPIATRVHLTPFSEMHLTCLDEEETETMPQAITDSLRANELQAEHYPSAKF